MPLPAVVATELDEAGAADDVDGAALLLGDVGTAAELDTTAGTLEAEVATAGSEDEAAIDAGLEATTEDASVVWPATH